MTSFEDKMTNTKQRRTQHKHTAAASTKPKPSHFDVNQAEQRLTSPKNEKTICQERIS